MQAAASESDLWQSNVASLRWAVTLRKPDAVARLKIQVERLDNEISVLVLRRSYVEDGTILERRLSEQIHALVARMDDLRQVGDLIRAAPLDHDHGPSPETAAKGREIVTGDGECTGQFVNNDPGIDDLSDELKRAASDVQMGWAVIVKGATFAVSGRTPGGIEVGSRAETLAKQYHQWVQELHRKRIGTWSFDDVVCHGMSRTECAQRRRCRVEAVRDQLVDGLTLYADTFPPLTD